MSKRRSVSFRHQTHQSSSSFLKSPIFLLPFLFQILLLFLLYLPHPSSAKAKADPDPDPDPDAKRYRIVDPYDIEVAVQDSPGYVAADPYAIGEASYDSYPYDPGVSSSPYRSGGRRQMASRKSYRLMREQYTEPYHEPYHDPYRDPYNPLPDPARRPNPRVLAGAHPQLPPPPVTPIHHPASLDHSKIGAPGHFSGPPKCALGKVEKTYCIDDFEYPKYEIADALLVHYEAVTQLYKDVFIETENSVDDIDDLEDEIYLCPAEIQYIQPMRAVNVFGKWRIIVNRVHLNRDTLTQTARIEECLDPGEVCDLVPEPYDTECIQKAVFHRFLVYDPFDQHLPFSIDSFKLPSTCTCFAPDYNLPTGDRNRRTPIRPVAALPPPPPESSEEVLDDLEECDECQDALRRFQEERRSRNRNRDGGNRRLRRRRRRRIKRATRRKRSFERQMDKMRRRRQRLRRIKKELEESS